MRHRDLSTERAHGDHHDRMPVILPPDERDRWLDPTANEAELRGLLVPLAAGELNADEVSALVTSPRNDSSDCVRPVGQDGLLRSAPSIELRPLSYREVRNFSRRR
jgi:SOS response associated peptidase (SRAP)